ncbi:hypothetical protein F4809DRAFT_175670 [Biscogniauxia mediterranea]|nr:hypothetical protein F4809DRAFT_175670 [Biscogniauxia mediterranea]
MRMMVCVISLSLPFFLLLCPFSTSMKEKKKSTVQDESTPLPVDRQRQMKKKNNTCRLCMLTFPFPCLPRRKTPYAMQMISDSSYNAHQRSEMDRKRKTSTGSLCVKSPQIIKETD